MDDDLPIFFRRVSPICGNIEEANAAVLSQYAAFGVVNPCVIIEPFTEESLPNAESASKVKPNARVDRPAQTGAEQ